MAVSTKERRVLENATRLSQSILWDLQSRYYTEKGIDAWRGGDIPSLASTNAYVARVYAESILAFLADAGAALDRAEPVYAIELGAGAGRLGFLVVKALERLQPLYPELDGVRVVYVLTDPVEANVGFWRQHEPIAQLMSEGKLALARWSSKDGPRLVLEPSGAVLEPAAVKNPLVGIANYVFDTLEADAFHIRDGKLHEALVTVAEKPKRGAAGEPARTGVTALDIGFVDRPIEGAYYGDVELDAVLSVYAAHLRDASVLLPVGALGAVRALLELGRDRALLLSADKGEARLESFAGIWDWGFTAHSGCFSVMANLHAIGTLFQHRGGQAFHGADPRDSFRFSAFAMGAGKPFWSLRRALDRPHEGFGLADLLGFTEPQKGDKATIDRVLAIVKACEYDPYIFGNYESVIDGLIDGLADEDRLALKLVMRKVEELDYRLGDHLDLPFVLGRLYYRMDDCIDALRCYHLSLKDSGPHEATIYNIGLCHEVLGEPARAAPMFRRALELKPGYLDAESRLKKMEGKLAALAGALA